MLIPNVMKGLEKSITFSRSEVMVKPATARSAFYRRRERERGMINNYHNFSLCKVITWIEEEEDMWIRSEGVERRAEEEEKHFGVDEHEPKNTRGETTGGPEGEPTTTEEESTGQERLNVADMNKRSVIMTSFLIFC